ncbi:hypothetical protein ACTWPT_05870 [Nonomuraea sp. 3N208]|uniref:hypothetical protein n=1 Tax=Nonomuraea sp. 3N208 TaxID=3457421 RepID=UPI003FCDF678
MTIDSPRAAWRRLDKQVRRELLRATQRHPDPQVAAVAAAYARSMLGLSGYFRRLVLPALLLVLLLLVALTASVIATFAASVEDSRFQLVALVLWVAGVIWFVQRDLRRLKALMRMEYANSPAVSVTPPASGPAAPLVVRYDMKQVRRDWALAGLFPGALVVVALVVGPPAVSIPLLALAVIGGIVLLSVRLDKPVLVLAESGVSLPRHGFTVPWPQISAIRLMPLPRGTGRSGSHRIVGFVLADEKHTLRTAPPRLAKQMRRSKSYFGNPLVIADKSLTSDAAAIVQAARALADVPSE